MSKAHFLASALQAMQRNITAASLRAALLWSVAILPFIADLIGRIRAGFCPGLAELTKPECVQAACKGPVSWPRPGSIGF